MRKYVVGFMFDSNRQYVVLIRKNRPEWQKGKLNGVGGKIEPGEEPIDAMVREFREETGVHSERSDWSEFALITSKRNLDPTGEDVEIHFYKSFQPLRLLNQIITTTDEVVIVYRLGHPPMVSYGNTTYIYFYESEVIPNVLWLIPLALSPYNQTAVVTNG